MERIIITQDELDSLLKEARENPIPCKVCKETFYIVFPKRKRRKFFTDCELHELIFTPFFLN